MTVRAAVRELGCYQLSLVSKAAIEAMQAQHLLITCNGIQLDNSNNRLYFPAHVLDVCGPSPVPPGRLVLSVTIRTVDVQHAKVRQNNVVLYLPTAYSLHA